MMVRFHLPNLLKLCSQRFGVFNQGKFFLSPKRKAYN